MKVLIAEDQAMIRGALAALLAIEDDIEVVAQVDRGDGVVEAAVKANPDVALLDIEMPGQDGITAAAELRKRLPSCRVLILRLRRARFTKHNGKRRPPTLCCCSRHSAPPRRTTGAVLSHSRSKAPAVW